MLGFAHGRTKFITAHGVRRHRAVFAMKNAHAGWRISLRCGRDACLLRISIALIVKSQ